MTESPDTKPPAYDVGYRNPPVHSRFQKGKSGNPSGRRSRAAAQSLSDLLRREGDRLLPIKEGGKLVNLRAIRAAARSMVVQAINGNDRATRRVISLMLKIDEERRIEDQARAKDDPDRVVMAIDIMPEWAAEAAADRREQMKERLLELYQALYERDPVNPQELESRPEFQEALRYLNSMVTGAK